ncbi:diguanylate cyclase [Candidatus Accumulibacter phosphatis]|uniref:diguanylate cyclase n=1 Tax=Candidatus Accumulibacter phosphatis TaxID=327160 RepID=UPI0019010424
MTPFQPFLPALSQMSQKPRKKAYKGTATRAIEHRCTVSVGVALFTGHEGDADDILQRADAAMYDAKEAGRNLIRFHDRLA